MQLNWQTERLVSLFLTKQEKKNTNNRQSHPKHTKKNPRGSWEQWRATPCHANGSNRACKTTNHTSSTVEPHQGKWTSHTSTTFDNNYNMLQSRFWRRKPTRKFAINSWYLEAKLLKVGACWPKETCTRTRKRSNRDRPETTRCTNCPPSTSRTTQLCPTRACHCTSPLWQTWTTTFFHQQGSATPCTKTEFQWWSGTL